MYNVTCWALVYASPIQMDPRWESNISEERRDRVRPHREETIMSQRTLAKKPGVPDDREKKRHSFIDNFKLQVRVETGREKKKKKIRPRDAPIVMFPSILLFSVGHIYLWCELRGSDGIHTIEYMYKMDCPCCCSLGCAQPASTIPTVF